MHKLEKRVEEWCRQIIRFQHRNLEELKDHLLCQIEQLMKGGLDEEEAFAEATARMGDAEQIRLENAKNFGLRARLMDTAYAWRSELSDNQLKKYLLRIALGTAALMMLSSAAFLPFDAEPGMWTINIPLLLWMIPSYFLTEEVDRRKKQKS